MTTRTNWREQAACLPKDPELFFPVGLTRTARRQAEQAKHVCIGCLVRDPCLTFALTADIEHGVWGGLSQEERQAVKRRAARTRARTAPLTSTG